MKIYQWMLLTCLMALPAIAVRAETVVIANARNADISLTIEQLKKIYLGKVTHLPNGSSVQPVDQPDGPQREAFYQAVIGKDSMQIDLYRSKQLFTGQGQPPIATNSAEEVIKLVTQHPDMIGYVDKALVTGDNVIVLLSIDGNSKEDSIVVYK